MSQKNAPAQLSSSETAVIKAHQNYPGLTVILAVKDAQKTAGLITKAQGRVVYDPNHGRGTSIPFLVADLPPGKLLDAGFIASLDLKAISLDSPAANSLKLMDAGANTAPPSNGPAQLYIPTQDVNIPQLRALDPGKGLGENAIVAVIDTGVDASHPVFQDRVIYWQDETQEGRFELKPAPIAQGKISSPGYEKVKLPDAFKGDPAVYVGTIDEAALSTQLSDADKLAGKTGIDLNRNGETDDQFRVLVGKDAATGAWIAYVDTSGDGTFQDDKLGRPCMDFNDARALKRQGKTAPYPELLSFPSEAATIAYPLIFGLNDQGEPVSLTVGFDGIDHGTHVAGIIGGDGSHLSGALGGFLGAAPKAQIMALKVCSGLTCTDQAMLRALIEAFYNPKGYIPDVVNLSIGSLQDNQEHVMDYLFRDLAEKFGATFVIANGNDGPAYRTGNSVGAFAPTIQVGAYVSKNSLSNMYTADPGLVGVPDDSLHFFTSLGPSFTGELRPNIVAPGSALSSIPLSDGGAEMMNGTSMATPLTTGSIAAMVSLARSEGIWSDVDSLRAAKAKGSGDSLIGIPLSIRESVEDSARSLAGYTMPQQGFGLLRIDQAFQKLKAMAPRLGQEPQDFFQLSVNDDAATNALYDRGINIAPAKALSFRLRPDGELSSAAALAISTTPITVKLEKVQVQSSDGSVAEATAPLPFSVGLMNGPAPDPTTTTVTLANSIRQGFVSIRHLDQMQPDQTYIAHYDLFQKGIRVMTLVDIIHKPIQLADTSASVSVPGIDPALQRLPAADAWAGNAIAPNAVHRHFVAVAPRDSALKIAAGFSPGAQGSLILTVNDPDGQQVFQQGFKNLPSLGAVKPVVTASVPIPAKPNGDTKSGIYEITVANGSVAGLNNTKYDLLIQAIRFKASADHVNLATGSGAAALKMGSQGALSVMNSSREVGLKNVKVGLDQPMLMETLKPFPIEPDRITLKRIHPPQVTGPDGSSTATVSVDFGLAGPPDFLEGRIDNHLYVIKPGATDPQAAYAADPSSSQGTAKVFTQVKRSTEDALYAAVETYFVDPTSPALRKDFAGIDVEVTYDVPAQAEGFVAALDNDASTEDVLLIDVSAPGQLTNAIHELSAVPGPKARAHLVLGSDDPSFQLKIPVTLFQ